MINELSTNSLAVDGLNRALATRQINLRYDFRVTDELGAVFSLSNGAVMNRSRSFDLDGGTWKLSLTVLKTRIPAGLTLSQYQQIAVDRGVGGGLWAYFRGVIQSIRESTTRRGGSIVEVLEVECEGNLVKMRGNYVTRLAMSITSTLRFHPFVGIARTVQYKHPASASSFGSGVTSTSVWALSGDSQMYLRELGGTSAGGGHDSNILTAVQVASNADFSTLYSAGGGSADYHAVTNVFPYQIHWKKTINPAEFYVRYRVVDRWILPKVRPTNLATGTATQTISLPAGYYLAHYIGTGSMTLSGGPTGTFSTNQVAAFNLTATTSVTFTLTGTVTSLEVINARGREPYFLCNRRDPQNLLPTTIGSVNVASRFITPTDVASYVTGVSDLGGTEPGLSTSGWSNKEYLTVTFSDGAERTVEITAISRTTGQMTVDVFPTHPTASPTQYAGPGDRIRVSTLEAVQAFDGRDPVALGELLTAGTSPQGLKPQAAGVYYPIGQTLPFTGHQNSGSTDLFWLSTSHVIPNRDAQDYTAWDSIDTGIRTIENGSASSSGVTITNTVEDSIRAITSSLLSAGPYDYTNDWVIDSSGIYTKHRTNASMYMDEVVKEIMAASYPPNVLIRDRVDGKLRLGPVTQAAVPQYVIPGVASVDVVDNADRITSLTVVSVNDQDDPADIASQVFAGVSVEGSTPTWDHPEWAFDGNDSTKTSPVDVTGDVESFLNTMWFSIPPANPLEAYPTIDSIRIAGRGVIIGVFYLSTTTPVQQLTQASLLANWSLLSSVDWIPLQSNQPFVIEGKDLVRLIDSSRYSNIAISVRQITDTTVSASIFANAGITAVEIMQRNVNAHTAMMTDNQNIASNATVNAAGFGTVWNQPDGNQNISFRYASQRWIKRNSVQYGNRVERLLVTARGTGYTALPTISITDGTGTDNACVAEIKSGRVIGTFVSRLSNRGFVNPPTVTFSSGAATAQAHIARGRTKIIRLGNMPQAECRTYAENYMDEYLRSHLVYTVQAPLLDYAEPGDTVLVQLPDGSQKALLLWGITDSGGPGDNMATYTLRDYSI